VAIELSPDQQIAADAIIAVLRGGSNLLTVGGFAGCGKSTTLAMAVDMADKRPQIAFCAFSGKAASVLKSKLEAASALKPGDYVGTIHGLIYRSRHGGSGAGSLCETDIDAKEAPEDRRPVEQAVKTNLAFDLLDDIDQGVIVVDEASMLSEKIFTDLKSFNRPIIAIGDHGQLPPVGCNFNLMEAPMVRLEKIHRQAEGDPIIHVSRLARENGRIPIGVYGEFVEKVQKIGVGFMDRNWINQDTMFLCGMNSTRIWWNEHLRNRYGFTSNDPEVGEKIICLKNNRDVEIYNGMTGRINSIGLKGRHWYHLSATMDYGNFYNGLCYKHQFGSTRTIFNAPDLAPWQIGDLFDWGYCMTTHKSQGSESENVVVLEERISRTEDDWRRWLYTSVTRSKKRLLIVGS